MVCCRLPTWGEWTFVHVSLGIPSHNNMLAHERLLLPSRDAIKGSSYHDYCDHSRDTELEGGSVVERLLCRR